MVLLRNKNNRVPDFNSFVTCSGNQFRPEFSSSYREDGTIELKESGRIDIQKRINSHLEETDMAIIIQKLQFGDTSVLSSKRPMYGDFTQFPTSYAGMLELVQRSEKAFESLDPKIKEKFDNNRDKWFSSIGSDFWMKEMGFIPVDPLVDPKTEPTD